MIFGLPSVSTQLIAACVIAYFTLSVAADAQIVALGASDVAGWFGVWHQKTWPTQLEEMLKAKGYNVQVKNAGVVLQNSGFRVDNVHLNAAGHKELATRLLPLVISALGGHSPGG